MIYTVRQGDTLGKIAYHFYGTYAKWPILAEYNEIASPNLIQVGDVIKLPPWEPRLFRWPLDRIEKRYYDFGDLYRVGPWKDRPHPGVDLHQYEGAPIWPIGEGRVVYNRLDQTGYGWYIMLEHRLANGQRLWSLYAHLEDSSKFDVGADVRSDDVIGWEGATGAAGVPHVHFEVKRSTVLGLYPHLTLHNLTDYYHDPSSVVANVECLCLPVQCWGCPKCS